MLTNKHAPAAGTRLWSVIGFGLLAHVTVATGAEDQQAKPVQRVEIRVGIGGGDLQGNDQRALQAAVDYVAQLGGGTVRIGPGRYQMRNALRLRDNVNIVGVPGETVLAACDGFASALAADGDANERQIPWPIHPVFVSAT